MVSSDSSQNDENQNEFEDIILPIREDTKHPDPLFVEISESQSKFDKNLVTTLENRIRQHRSQMHKRTLESVIEQQSKGRESIYFSNEDFTIFETTRKTNDDYSDNSSVTSTIPLSDTSTNSDKENLHLPVRLNSKTERSITKPKLWTKLPSPKWDWEFHSVSSSIWESSDTDTDSEFQAVSSTSTNRKALELWPHGFAVTQKIDESKIKSISKFGSIEVFCPYSGWMKPQHQILECLIDCLELEKHGILESPTGSGKTASLLCGVLAWQRSVKLQQAFKAASDSATLEPSLTQTRAPVVYFCTRTHLQIAQVIKELKTLPYRPVTVCLGAPKHLCAYTGHAEDEFDDEVALTNAQNGRVERYQKFSWTAGKDLRGVCRAGVSIVERKRMQRKKKLERLLARGSKEELKQFYETWLNRSLVSDRDLEKGIECGGCPFYAAMDMKAYAERITKQMTPPVTVESQYGDNNYEKTQPTKEHQASCSPTLPSCDGLRDIEEMKRLTSCSGSKTNKKWLRAGKFYQENFADYINESQQSLDAEQQQPITSSDDIPGCPYYTSMALCGSADLIILPYQFVVCPFLKSRNRLPMNGSVVIFDEAHNIESTCREEASSSLGMATLIEFLDVFRNLIEAFSGKSPEDFYDEALYNYHHESPTRLGDELDRFQLERTFGDLVFAFFRQTLISDYCQLLNLAISVWFLFRDLQEKCNRLAHDKYYLLQNTTRNLDNTVPQTVKTWGQHEADSRRRGCRDFFDQFCLERRIIFRVQEDLTELISLVQKWINQEGPSLLNMNLRQLLINFSRKTMSTTFSNIASTLEVIQLGFTYSRCYIVSLELDPPMFTSWSLVFALMTPAPIIQELANKCRTIILASGTLTPIDSLISELGPQFRSRLHRTLTASHIVSKNNLIGIIHSSLTSPDGKKIEARCNASNLSRPEFLIALGSTLTTLVSYIPGGVLLFVPSYKVVDQIQVEWNKKLSNGLTIWEILKEKKKTVIIEERESDKFKEVLKQYREAVDTTGHAFLIGIYRAKISEGFSINDNYIRGVILVGVPYPKLKAPEVMRKQAFNDQLILQMLQPQDLVQNCATQSSSGSSPQENNLIEEAVTDTDILTASIINNHNIIDYTERRLMNGINNIHLDELQRRRQKDWNHWINGQTWYELQAYRAINQALGRVIRHKNDYGVIILIDSRHVKRRNNSLQENCFQISNIRSRISAWELSGNPLCQKISQMASQPVQNLLHMHITSQFCEWVRPFLHIARNEQEITRILEKFFLFNDRKALQEEKQLRIRLDHFKQPDDYNHDDPEEIDNCNQASPTEMRNAIWDNSIENRKPQKRMVRSYSERLCSTQSHDGIYISNSQPCRDQDEFDEIESPT